MTQQQKRELWTHVTGAFIAAFAGALALALVGATALNASI